MEEKTLFIKNWLKTGSINIFGLPMSGKDTVGNRLASALDAEFLSSGDIIRKYETEHQTDLTGDGQLAPTDKFYDIVLPYFAHSDLAEKPLVLSSIGRWSGEEDAVMDAAKNGNHEIKVVVELELSEDDVKTRWEKAQELTDRGNRADDSTPEIFERRLTEFKEKTIPVLEHYKELNKLVKVDASPDREQVFENAVNTLFDFANANLTPNEKGNENA